jgi:hypothetical protein
MIAETLRRSARLTVGTIALASLSGCSLAFIEKPPRDHASRQFFDCTSSMLAPGLDAALAGVLALSVVGTTSDGSHDAAAIVEESALVVAALASATYGYLQVSHCRDAKEALAERLFNMPYRSPYPPYPPYLGAPPVGMLPPLPAAAAPGERAIAPAARDPWLSEGPPPPPYLRLAPQVAPPAPPPTAPAPATPAPTAPGSQP